MSSFLCAIGFENRKVFFQKSLWITFGVVVVLQPLLAFVSAKQLVQLGLDATPLTHPELAVALPPLDYFGFDLALLGQVAIVVFGCMLGALEFKDNQLRITLLSINKRSISFFAKLLATVFYGFLLSIIALFTTISLTHIGLGENGLHPVILSGTAWLFIFYTTVDWLFLVLLSFGLGIIFQNAVVPILLLIPQVVGLGGFLAQKWEWGNYLPVAAGNLLFASPTDTIAHDPIKGSAILLVWTIVVLAIAFTLFRSRDMKRSA